MDHPVVYLRFDSISSIFKDAEKENGEVQEKLSEIRELSTKLAAHFCEPDKSFKLEECLTNFNVFCGKVKQCEKENEQRKVQEERAEKRKIANEKMKALKGSK